MDFAQFQTALAALPSVPEAERSRALTVAGSLVEGDLVEFIRYLTDVDRRLQEIDGEEERELTQMDLLVTEGEKLSASVTLMRAENADHADGTASIEKQIRDCPNP